MNVNRPDLSGRFFRRSLLVQIRTAAKVCGWTEDRAVGEQIDALIIDELARMPAE